MQKIKTLALFIIILVAGSACNIIFESKSYKSGALHFGLAYMCLLFIAVTGYVGWRALQQIWLSNWWLIIYAVYIVVTLMVKFTDVFLFTLPRFFTFITGRLNIFFISPLPFIGVYILSGIFSKRHFDKNAYKE